MDKQMKQKERRQKIYKNCGQMQFRKTSKSRQ